MKTDSQSIKDITSASKTMMENQHKKIKKKHLDALCRIDSNRFCKSNGSRYGFTTVIDSPPL
jgi:Tfp pilus assembly major pilin PilA